MLYSFNIIINFVFSWWYRINNFLHKSFKIDIEKLINSTKLVAVKLSFELYFKMV